MLQLPVIAFGPEGVASLGVHQLGGYAKAIGFAANAPLDNVRGIQLLTHMGGRHRFVAVGEHRGTGEDAKFQNLGNLGGDVFGDAITKVFVFFLPTQVLEVKHSERALGLAASYGCPLEIRQQVTRRLVTIFGILLQAAEDNFFHASRQRGPEAARCGRLAMKDGIDQRG